MQEFTALAPTVKPTAAIPRRVSILSRACILPKFVLFDVTHQMGRSGPRQSTLRHLESVGAPDIWIFPGRSHTQR
jgi:hypothetical protein